MTYAEIYRAGKEALEKAGIEEADQDARLLLEYVCGTDRNYLLVHGDNAVEEEKRLAYRELTDQRALRIPLQQLTGIQFFMGLEFRVNEHVLIPRQETEILVEEVLKYLHDGMRVLDMCTGSGCILISLLRYTNGCRGLGVDISPKALEVAEDNAARLLSVSGNSENAPELGSLRFLESDLFENVEGIFDVIVSNPPYIPSAAIETLMPEVRDHEPGIALDGRDDGLFFYRKITEECKEHLAGGGMLFFEIGFDQGEAVRSLMEQHGFLEVQVLKDYAGLDRVVFGTLGFGL